MDIFSLLGIFVIFPFGAALIGALYVRLFLKRKTITSAIAGVLWIVYAIYEDLMYSRVLCTGECNIRLDLLLILPVLLAFSLLATMRYYRKPRPTDMAG